MSSQDTERADVTSFQGKPLTLVGPVLKAGDPAPGFALVDTNFAPVQLSETAGKMRLLSVSPSFDGSETCQQTASRWNQELAKLPGVVVYHITADLPFAQGRFCKPAGITYTVLSCYQDIPGFSKPYGAFIKEFHLPGRAIFVVGPDNRLRYVEYVKGDLLTHPDYDKALAALK